MDDEHIGSELLISYLNVLVCHLSRFDYISSKVPQDNQKRLAFYVEVR